MKVDVRQLENGGPDTPLHGGLAQFISRRLSVGIPDVTPPRT